MRVYNYTKGKEVHPKFYNSRFVSDENDTPKICEPSNRQKFWRFYRKNRLKPIRAQVYLIHYGETKDVPFAWICNFFKCAYWTAQEQFTCYYTTQPEAEVTTRSRKLNKHNNQYTVNVLELFGTLLVLIVIHRISIKFRSLDVNLYF